VSGYYQNAKNARKPAPIMTSPQTNPNQNEKNFFFTLS